MRNLWQFLVKYSNLLLFLLLEVVALFFVFSKGGLPHSAWVSSANRVTGSFYQAWDNVTTYFFLRSENERLVRENVELQNRITRLENQLEGQLEAGLPDTVPAYVYAVSLLIHGLTSQLEPFLIFPDGPNKSFHVSCVQELTFNLNVESPLVL